jgi:hypothetical protein
VDHQGSRRGDRLGHIHGADGRRARRDRLLLTNANGVIYKGLLQDRLQGTGHARRPVQGEDQEQGHVRPGRGEGVGNLSNATVPLMGVQAVIGDTNAAYKSEWQKRSNGWRLKLPPS